MGIKLTRFTGKDNWVDGEVDGGKYKFTSKLFDEGSEYGISGGRISKLTIKHFGNSDLGREFAHYERGWDVEPQTAEEKKVCKAVIKFLEDTPKTRFD